MVGQLANHFFWWQNSCHPLHSHKNDCRFLKLLLLHKRKHKFLAKVITELTLSQIWIYPVKSLGGILLPKAQLEARGLQHDRRWLVVDDNHRFLSQREHPEMALIEVALDDNALLLSHRTKPLAPLRVPFLPQTFDLLKVSIWDDTVEAVVVGDACNHWLSQALGRSVRLVYMPDTSPRPADPDYAHFDTDVSFADGFPYLIIGQTSLDDLNSRLVNPVEMARFRPNFVVEGALPYDEDQWYEFEIGNATFWGVKPCARCVMTTVNPQTGQIDGKEPLKMLASYRKRGHKIFFGQNVITRSAASVETGDGVRVISRKTRETFSV